MPPGFTKMYAERLDRLCAMEVREAQSGDELRRGGQEGGLAGAVVVGLADEVHCAHRQGIEHLHGRDRVIIGLGASPGGTEATLAVMKRLPADIPPMVIVQHMPPGFTKMFRLRATMESSTTMTRILRRLAGLVIGKRTSSYRDNVIFQPFNLMDPIHFRRKFDVIFCRNVMIYFDQHTKDALVHSSSPGGWCRAARTRPSWRRSWPGWRCRWPAAGCPTHLDLFCQKIIPDIVQRHQRDKTLAIWSAGCSTGEEPYNITISPTC